MTWVRIDDTFPEHPKVLEVGGDAAWLHVCGLAYCARNLTDGLIHRNAIRRLSDRKSPINLANALVNANIWDRDGDDYRIHDYLKYNPSREQVEIERAQRSAAKSRAGKLGGIASGIAKRKHDGKQNESTTEANEKQTESKTVAPTRPDPSRPLDIQVDRQTDSLNTRNPVGLVAVALYAEEQQPTPGVRDVVKWREGIARTVCAERWDEIAAYLGGHATATAEQVAFRVLGVAKYAPVGREAWYANPHCETCDGDGWRNHAPEGSPSMLGPCPCRSDEPSLATVTEIRQAAG